MIRNDFQGSGVRSQGSAKKLNPAPCTLHPERGSILVGVLWSLFFLTALALAIQALITPQLSLAAKLRDRFLLRYMAEAGMKRAVIELRIDETEEYDALNESWSNNEEVFKEIGLTDDGYFSLEYTLADDEESGEEGGKRYGLIDEESKLNINKVSADVLKEFFVVVGNASSQQATDIADAIIDWIDEDDDPLDNGAEDSYYQSLNPGYPCKNAGFEILEELLLVKEVTQEIFDLVKGHLTVYGGGRVNVNTADALVLQGLGLSSGLVEKIVKFREGSDGEIATEDDNIFEDADAVTATLSSGGNLLPEETNQLNAVLADGLLTVRSDYFRGYSVGGLKGQAISAKIVFVIDREENVRYWREN